MSDAYSSFHQQQPKQQGGPLEERTLQEHEIIVREARQLHWKKAPHFVHKSLVAGLGETKKVILASNDGQYPNRMVDASFTTMTGRWWDDNHNYWTIDLNQQTIIVTKLGGNRINGYRQCIGVQDNAMVYSRKCVAFDSPLKDSGVGLEQQPSELITWVCSRTPRPRNAQRSRQPPKSSPEHLSARASHLSDPTVNTGRCLPELTSHPIASTRSPKIEPSHDVNPLIRPGILAEQVIDLTYSPTSRGRAIDRRQTTSTTTSGTRTGPNAQAKVDALDGEENRLKRRLGAILEQQKAMLEEELRDVKRQKANLVQRREN
ncbi:MAG: hypothetical protein Q9215_000477 [Flavoplaca cf. flavocitrina]